MNCNMNYGRRGSPIAQKNDIVRYGDSWFSVAPPGKLSLPRSVPVPVEMSGNQRIGTWQDLLGMYSEILNLDGTIQNLKPTSVTGINGGNNPVFKMDPQDYNSSSEPVHALLPNPPLFPYDKHPRQKGMGLPVDADSPYDLDNGGWRNGDEWKSTSVDEDPKEDMEVDFGAEHDGSGQMNKDESGDEKNIRNKTLVQEQGHSAQESAHVRGSGLKIQTIPNSEPENELQSMRNSIACTTTLREHHQNAGKCVLTSGIQMHHMMRSTRNTGEGSSPISAGEFKKVVDEIHMLKERLNTSEKKRMQLEHIHDVFKMQNNVLKSGYEHTESRFNQLKNVFRLSCIHLREKINMFPCDELNGAGNIKEKMQELIDEALAEFEHQAEFIAKY